MTSLRTGFIAAFAAVVLSIFAVAPAQSGPAEMALLESYIGSWSGEGLMVGGEAPEKFKCRLTVAKGNNLKINYAGRCKLVNMNLSVSGTIEYDEGARHYQAVMSSNAGFTGLAVGRKSGSRISFDLAERQTDRGGNDVRIGSLLVLEGNKITVDFEVEFNNSGQLLTARVPFSK
jgi:hypothetical protein